MAGNARRRAGLRGTAEGAVAGLVAGVGAAIAIFAMEWVSRASHYPLAIIPFATSIVLVVGSPDAEPAQPRALIGGHVVSTIAGLALLKFTGPHAWAAAAGVGLAVIAMYLTGTFHPPAGINLQQSSLVILVRASACRRAAADGLCLCLAPLDGPPALAAALAIATRQGRRDQPQVKMTPWRPRSGSAAENDRRHGSARCCAGGRPRASRDGRSRR